MRAWTYFRAAAVTAALGSAACDGAGGGGEVAVEAIEPNQGPLGGGQTVTITGSGFLAGGSAPDLALFGSVLTTQVSPISDTELQVVTPHNFVPGDVDVIVFNTNGFNVADGAYTYLGPPTIESVTAPTGHYKGGDEVTITGTGFKDFEAGQPVITFDGVPATNVRVLSETEILAIVPRGAPLRRATAAISNNRGDAAKVEAYLYLGTGLLAISGRNDPSSMSGVYFIDGDTAETSFVSPINRDEAQIQGMSTAADGTVYGAATHVESGQTTDRSLYIVHPSTGELAQVGSMAPGDFEGEPPRFRVPDIEFHDGVLYGFNREDQSFGSIDTDTGVFTRIGDVGTGYCCYGSGLVSDGNTLYFISYNQIRPVEIETGLLGSPQSIAGIPSSLSGWTYFDGAIYAVERGFRGGQEGILVDLRGGDGGGGGVQIVSRVLRIDLDEEPLTAVPFATIPTKIHGLAVAPEIPTGGVE